MMESLRYKSSHRLLPWMLSPSDRVGGAAVFAIGAGMETAKLAWRFDQGYRPDPSTLYVADEDAAGAPGVV